MHTLIVRRLAHRKEEPALKRYVTELFAFGYKNALACLFPVFIFGMLAVSHIIHIPGLYRYDFLLIACIGMLVVMYYTGLETKDEVKVITLFHLLGLLMELHKVNLGSWSYPEEGWTKFGGVPLYSGFMYASVASYICQAWRRFDLEMINWPPKLFSIPLGAAIYLNFFTNAYMQDVRWYIAALLVLVFANTWVRFNNNGPIRRMPMLLAFFLIGFFIWLAENIATFLGAWKYAYQHDGWQAVHIQKLSSWSLLVIVSVIIVAHLKFVKDKSVPAIK
ncbi:MAG: DUF817 domain-containing protein [Bacteroidota bacterium]|nr:DUF817 domain-containing protein [Bacteroidota bacterium]